MIRSAVRARNIVIGLAAGTQRVHGGHAEGEREKNREKGSRHSPSGRGSTARGHRIDGRGRVDGRRGVIRQRARLAWVVTQHEQPAQLLAPDRKQSSTHKHPAGTSQCTTDTRCSHQAYRVGQIKRHYLSFLLVTNEMRLQKFNDVCHTHT